MKMNIGTLISNISIIIASGTAIYGINSWRREFKGKRQIELAEKVLAMFYEAEDAIKHIRNPISFVGEVSTRESAKNETAKEKKARDNAYVVYERYQKQNELFSKIHSMRYQFMAQFGRDSALPFDKLRKIINDIFSASRLLSYYWSKDDILYYNEERIQKHMKNVEKYEAIIWEDFSEDDPIKSRLNHVIAEIEKICRDIITSKKTFFINLSKMFKNVVSTILMYF